MQEPGLIGSFPWIRTVAIWGNYPHSSHPEFPLGTQSPIVCGVAFIGEGLMEDIHLPS